jgi:uncharacterized lipoprotein YehR (DUF1307 family)
MSARIVFMVMAGALASGALSGADVILDRIAVTVGKQVITEGEVVRDLRVAALLDHKPVDLSGEEKRKAADRLVDQLLIQQEIAFSRIPLGAEEEAARMLAQVESQYGSAAGYQAALVRYHVTEADVANHLITGVRALQFTDLRFHPEIDISEDDLRDFYNKLSEEGRKRGDANIPTFESSRDDVEKFVVGQRITLALDRWLGAQRTQTQILYREQVFQ